VTRADTYRLIALLDDLNQQLESAMESLTMPGEPEPRGITRSQYADWRRCRRLRRISEDFLIGLCEALEAGDGERVAGAGGAK
jgi:hypothetical protein